MTPRPGSPRLRPLTRRPTSCRSQGASKMLCASYCKQAQDIVKGLVSHRLVEGREAQKKDELVNVERPIRAIQSAFPAGRQRSVSISVRAVGRIGVDDRRGLLHRRLLVLRLLERGVASRRNPLLLLLLLSPEVLLMMVGRMRRRDKCSNPTRTLTLTE